MSNRKALCVGINLYRNYPSATLHGFVLISPLGLRLPG
jgi:hypothetical protein